MRPVIGCCVWSLIMDALVCWEHPTCDALDRLRPLRAAPAAPCMVTGFPPPQPTWANDLMIVTLCTIITNKRWWMWFWVKHWSDMLQWLSAVIRLQLYKQAFPSSDCISLFIFQGMFAEHSGCSFFFFSRFSCLKILLSHHRLSAA